MQGLEFFRVFVRWGWLSFVGFGLFVSGCFLVDFVVVVLVF